VLHGPATLRGASGGRREEVILFKVSKAAAKEIRRSADAADTEDLALRVAARRGQDGGIEYRMGFDEVGLDDVMLNSSGVDVIIGKEDKALLSGATLDYVEIEPGQHRFIFLNPNDPHYEAPRE
jgi:iron-sulfur cluster assembly protein